MIVAGVCELTGSNISSSNSEFLASVLVVDLTGWIAIHSGGRLSVTMANYGS
jgi:hypothetical protein